MIPILLATTATTYALFGAAFALVLLLIFQVRLARKHEAIEASVERMAKAQKQTAVDARTRMDEVTRAVDRLAEELQPKLGQVELGVTKLSERLDGFERQVDALHPQTEEAARRVKHLEASTDAVHLKAEAAEKLVQNHRTRVDAVNTGLKQLDERVASLASELSDTRKGMEAAKEAQAALAQLRAELREVAEQLQSLPAQGAPDAPQPQPSPPPQPMHAVAAETRPATGRAAEPTSIAATPPAATPPATVTPRVDANEQPAPEGKDEQAAGKPPAVRVVEPAPAVADFTFEEADEDEHAPGTRGMLALVIVLALLTLAFSLVGGR